MVNAGTPGLNRNHSNHKSIPRQTLIACAGILILASAIMLPVFVKGFPAGFDAVRHYRWSSQFIDGLSDGALYPLY